MHHGRDTQSAEEVEGIYSKIQQSIAIDQSKAIEKETVFVKGAI